MSRICETVGPVTILLVRHARAGRRDRWRGDDRLRPLSKAGKAQAQALPDLLLGIGGDQPRLVSSPWVRCIETLAPLAAVLGLAVETDDTLGEGMGDKAVEAMSRWMDGPSGVFCTHGDVVERILGELADHGVNLGRRPQAAKGSVWVLTGSEGKVRAARYLPPPA
jgi:broad specificity phosphatase PhoE